MPKLAKLTPEQFIHRSRLLWGDKYAYDKVVIINTRTPVILHCKKHQHDFQQTPKAHFIAKHECCPLCYQQVSGTFQNQWRQKIVSDSACKNKGLQDVLNSVFSG